MTSRQLQKLCDEWVNRLGLSGWMVQAKFTNERGEMYKQGYADVDISETTREVALRLLRFKYRDSKKNVLISKDYEVDLVHELLHIWVEQFRKINMTERDYTVMEQFIESMARVLVALKRAGLPEHKPPVVLEPS